MGKTRLGSNQRLTRSAARVLSEGRTIERRCNSRLHSEPHRLGMSKNVRVHNIRSKDYRRTSLQWLQTHGYISIHQRLVCSSCLEFATNSHDQTITGHTSIVDHSDIQPRCSTTINSVDQETTRDGIDIGIGNTIGESGDTDNIISESGVTEDTISESGDKCSIDESIQHVVHFLNKNKINLKRPSISMLYNELGKALRNTIYNDSKYVHSSFKNLEDLSNINCRDFLNERPTALISLLCGLTAVDMNDSNKALTLCMAVESIYKLRNGNFIGPFSLSNALVKWSLSGSKTAQSIDGTSSACGSVTTLKNVLKESATCPNSCPKGDVDIFFDNTQRTGKTVRVRENGTTPVGIATNVVYIQSNPSNPTNLQSRSEYMPCEWSNKNETVFDDITNLEDNLNTNYYRPYRHQYQSDILDAVWEEVTLRPHGLEDHITVLTSLDDTDKNRVCSRCSRIYPKSLECPYCQNKPRVNRNDIYGGIPSGHPPEKTLVQMGEIIGVNPSSRASLKLVLSEISNQAKIGTDRKWIRLGCDGVPYRIVDDIIKKVVVCQECKQEIDLSKISFTKHVEIYHKDTQNVQYKLSFPHILLVPGAGHIEKNLLIRVFRLCNRIFMDYLAGCLGFRSKRAREFAIGCSNHHVAWQMLTISLEAFAHELVYQYLLDRKRNGDTNSKPTANDMMNWRNNSVHNPNYNLLFDIVFNVLLGLKCYRNGIRLNNSKYALAGRQKVAPLMYCGKHMIYQHLLSADMKIRIEAPDEVKQYIETNESFARSGDNTTGEGGDYVTEAENRTLKQNLPPGVPTVLNWTMASRCDKHLKKIRGCVFQNSHLKDPGLDKTTVFEFDNEIQMFRSKIRLSGLLDEPRIFKPLKSIEGNPLHQDLVNFYFTACDNYAAFKNGEMNTQVPIFVTPEDENNHNNVKNWTIKEIDASILRLIEKFNDTDRANMLKCLFETDLTNKRAKKEEHVSFYVDVKAELEAEAVSDPDEEVI